MQGRAPMHTAHTVKYRPLPYETEGYAFFFFFKRAVSLLQRMILFWSITLRALADQQVIE